MPDQDAITLKRLLASLEQTILDPDTPLRSNKFQRNKTTANLDYARSLLRNLEQSSPSKPGARHANQATLRAQRELIKRLAQRLKELESQDTSWDDDDAVDSEPEQEQAAPTVPPDTSDSNLRSRKPGQQDPEGTSTSNALFEGRSGPSNLGTSGSADADASKDQVLTHHRSLQSDLTESLLSTAQALRTQASSLAVTISEDKGTVDLAGQAMDKSTSGLEKQMGLVKRLSEEQGLWGRLMLYLWIGGLWVALLVVVFVLPKIRI
ncbi:hypothetical protein P152DRAFT_456177 [Eremomyces bilateralis CBS 781.70]|uniref:Synaptobrevin n=1 Tax=Eremomyces bilateralis CBS 781.70 TaxID=1392243 RepID=A0A6G1GAN3_9PEZI|nr:uncharacterized protein P152DRAFT_456177 [Eremomyces bilateralis CBS 781.70]KAF1815125.1 hypothetical protein P152DRAFT_456177 [Eremomyces bilateralis CBS 781.70]